MWRGRPGHCNGRCNIAHAARISTEPSSNPLDTCATRRDYRGSRQHSLYAYVRDVALAADAARPWTVSKRAFDRTRRQHERFAGGLSSDGVIKRLLYPWPQLLAVVLDETRDNERSISAGRS